MLFRSLARERVRAPATADRFTPDLLDGLDEPVRRFLAHAIARDAPLAPAMRVEMRGRIRAGPWLPYRAVEIAGRDFFTWRAHVPGGPGPIVHLLSPLTVTDRFDRGAATMTGHLLGVIPVLHADDPDTIRSAACRAALEAVVFAPVTLVRHARWRVIDEDMIAVATSVPPERPEVTIAIDADGAPTAVSADRWRTRRDGYVRCGALIRGSRRFGPYRLPARLMVGWHHGSPRFEPFLTAEILAARARSRP